MTKERTTLHNPTPGLPGVPAEPASKTGWILAYGTALLSVLVAILLSEWIVPDGHAAFPIFYGAVMVSGWYGGLGPGLLATALSALAGNFLFLPPAFSLALGFSEAVHTGVFIVVALLITLLNEARRQAERSLVGQRHQLHTAISSISDAVIATNTRGRVTFMNPVAEALTGWWAADAQGQPLEVVFRVTNEQNGMAVKKTLPQVKRSGFAVGLASQSLLVAKDGRETPIDYSAATVTDNIGRVAGIVLVFDNISERKQAQQAAREAAERTARLQAVTAALSEALTVQDVAAVTINQGVAAMGAVAGLIALLDSAGDTLEVVHAINYPPELLERWRRFALDASLPLAESARTSQPIFVESMEALRQRFPEVVSVMTPGHRAVAAIPLEIEGRVAGSVGLSFAETHTFSDEDRGLILSLVRQCAQAFQRAQLYEAERAARTEAEQAQYRFYAAATDNARLYLEAQEEITARKRVEEQLTRSLREKEVLLREVHHRVKNNLQAISNLLYLQANYVDDGQIRSKLAEAQNRVKSIALIHEKLYQTRDLDHLDFAEYLRGLTNHLINSFVDDPGRVALNLQVGPEKVNLDTAVPLGIIITELVSNSLKYAFPGIKEKTDDGRSNQIRIALEAPEEDQLLLTVADNGVGLPEEIDPDSAPSLGLQLVRMLAGHMGGALELDRRNGTTYRIKLCPVKMDKSFTP